MEHLYTVSRPNRHLIYILKTAYEINHEGDGYKLNLPSNSPRGIIMLRVLYPSLCTCKHVSIHNICYCLCSQRRQCYNMNVYN